MYGGALLRRHHHDQRQQQHDHQDQSNVNSNKGNSFLWTCHHTCTDHYVGITTSVDIHTSLPLRSLCPQISLYLCFLIACIIPVIIPMSPRPQQTDKASQLVLYWHMLLVRRQALTLLVYRTCTTHHPSVAMTTLFINTHTSCQFNLNRLLNQVRHTRVCNLFESII